jgi:hypothetical protein
MTNNRYTFETTLEGFVNVAEPSGKFQNCCFSFRIPAEVLKGQVEPDRAELLEWAASKGTTKRTNDPKWDEDGLVKYTYNQQEEGVTKLPEVVFVDTDGDILPLEVRKGIRKGTKVVLIVQQKPYTKPKLGTKLIVLGAQVLELNSGQVIDSGDLAQEDVAALFGKRDGFKLSAPNVVAAEVEPDAEEEGGYDF